MHDDQVVYILTWCHDVERLYGSTLVFETLRLAFPTTPVYVVDNQSVPAARRAIQQKTEICSATFVQLRSRVRHYYFIEEAIRRQESGTAIFVDPDICFWQNVESWNFDSLLAGRLIPKHFCQFSNATTHPRLHTSFLWVNDVKRMRAELGALDRQQIQFSGFRAASFKLDGNWQFLDCGAAIYSALPDEMFAFEESHLNAYDHLFCGSHADRITQSTENAYLRKFRQSHLDVQDDYRTLKGAWRWQHEYFESARIDRQRAK